MFRIWPRALKLTRSASPEPVDEARSRGPDQVPARSASSGSVTATCNELETGASKQSNGSCASVRADRAKPHEPACVALAVSPATGCVPMVRSHTAGGCLCEA
eukprot:4845649-Prymnesium_polylepis.1